MTAPLLFSDDLFISSPLDDGLLIARPADDRLFVFNSTARFIWERLLDGAGESEITALIAARFGIDLRQAQKDFTDTLLLWRDHGLIRPCSVGHRYEIAGLGLDIRCNDRALAGILAPMLAHLASDRMDTPALEIDLDSREGALFLRLNGVEAGRSSNRDELIAKLLNEVFRYVSDKAEWVMSLHAAAVAAAGQCVIMPGASGTGKSSLTAALLSFDDLQFVADDLVLLVDGRLQAVPVPLPIIVKSGSWDALYSMLPDLAACAVYRRFDRDCRYWLPPPERIARKPIPVKAVVFPRYVLGAATTLTPLSPLEAFGRITAAPSAVRRPITSLAIEALAKFARNAPAYSLIYGALVDAREIVKGLLLT